MNTTVRASLWALAAALAIPILLLGAYFVHGSLEDFPTDEQQAKVRVVSGAGILILTLLEALLVVAFRRGRKSKGLVQEHDDASTAKLNEVYSTEDSALDPILQSIQSRSVKKKDS